MKISQERIPQEEETQCQDCGWWTERNGNTCFPRAVSYVLSPINETAMPAHKQTFIDCHFKVTPEEYHKKKIGKL